MTFLLVGIELTRLPLDEQILRTPVGSSYTCDSPTILNLEVPSKTVITECEIEIPSIEVQPFFVPTSGFSPGKGYAFIKIDVCFISLDNSCRVQSNKISTCEFHDWVVLMCLYVINEMHI